MMSAINGCTNNISYLKRDKKNISLNGLKNNI